MSPYPHHVIELARGLRKRSTPAEKILWKRLRNRGVGGLKFKRQKHIGRYRVDFYCDKLKLALEVEGGFTIWKFKRIMIE